MKSSYTPDQIINYLGLSKQKSPFSFHWAKITAVSSGKYTIQIGNSTMSADVSLCTCSKGDSVLVLNNKSQLIILGKRV